MNFKLIIGLGNPDKKYENTYHNVGHLAVNYLKSSALCSLPSALINSNAYMNESGNFVKKILKKYKTKPEELLIIHDDSDIILGKYKLSFNRGSAGHKGVESIIKSMGIKNFCRLRIGIRPQKNEPPFNKTLNKKRPKAENFVLAAISKNDKKILSEVFEKLAAEIFTD